MIAPELYPLSKDFTRPKPDPEAAKKLLAEAGYADGFEVTMDCPNDRYVNDAAICQAIVGMMALLEVKGLVKHFVAQRSLFGRALAHVKAVDGVSFSLEAGKTLALVGESGCGKSTVSRLVLRLIEPDAGTVRFDGRDLLTLDADALRKFRREAQIIFQDPYASLNPRMFRTMESARLPC